MESFKVGDKVKLVKLEGPEMLISSVGMNLNGPVVACCYFDSLGVFHGQDMAVAVLEKIEDTCG